MTWDEFDEDNGGSTPGLKTKVLTMDSPELDDSAEGPNKEGPGFLSSTLDKAGDLAMRALDYLGNPEEGPALDTHNIRVKQIMPAVKRAVRADTQGVYAEGRPEMTEDYAMQVAQAMMDSDGVTPGSSHKVLRKLQELTGERVGPRIAMVVRRYIKDPNTISAGVGPLDALGAAAMQAGAGLGRTVRGMFSMAGKSLQALGAEDIGGDLQEWGEDGAATADAYLEMEKERGKSTLLGEAGAMIPMLFPTRMLTTLAATSGYGAGQGMGTQQALTTGVVDATLLGLLNKMIPGSGKTISANELEKNGVSALNKRRILTDNRDLVNRLEDTTGKSIDEVLKDTAKFMRSTGKEALTEDQIVRMAVQNMTGGAEFSPRAGKYLGKAEALDSTVAPKLMKEAQARLDDVRQSVKGNPELGELVESFIQKNGNFEAGDWAGLQRALKDFGLPADGPLMTRIGQYSKMDDVTMLGEMQKANPSSNQNLSRVGQRGDWGAQAEAEYMDKIRQFVYSKIPGINTDEKVIQSIIRSMKDPAITPSKLKQTLEAIAPPGTRITDDMIDELMNEATGKFPESGSGTAGEQVGELGGQPIREVNKNSIPLIDKSELDSKVNMDLSGAPNTTGPTHTTESIIGEFSSHGEALDDVLQEGMDMGLEGGRLRNFVKLQLEVPGKSNTLQSHPQVGGTVVGASAGVEENEDGSYGYDPVKGLAGAAVGAAATSKTGIKVGKELGEHVVNKFGDSSLNMQPKIVPSNSRSASMQSDELLDAGWVPEEVAELGARQGKYTVDSRLIDLAEKFPEAKMKAQSMLKWFDNQGLTKEEKTFSKFEEWVHQETGDDLTQQVSKEDMLDWIHENAGKESRPGGADDISTFEQSYPDSMAAEDFLPPRDKATLDRGDTEYAVNYNEHSPDRVDVGEYTSPAHRAQAEKLLKLNATKFKELGYHEYGRFIKGSIGRLRDDVIHGDTKLATSFTDTLLKRAKEAGATKPAMAALKEFTDSIHKYDNIRNKNYINPTKERFTSGHSTTTEPFYTRTTGAGDSLVVHELQSDYVAYRHKHNIADKESVMPFSDWLPEAMNGLFKQAKVEGKTKIVIPLNKKGTRSAPEGTEFRDDGRKGNKTTKWYMRDVVNRAKAKAKELGVDYRMGTKGDTDYIEIDVPAEQIKFNTYGGTAAVDQIN